MPIEEKPDKEPTIPARTAAAESYKLFKLNYTILLGSIVLMFISLLASTLSTWAGAVVVFASCLVGVYFIRETKKNMDYLKQKYDLEVKK